MNLKQYLNQFSNIAWYPSAHNDVKAMTTLSFKSLKAFGITKEDVPDCFIYTDFKTCSNNSSSDWFFLDSWKYEDEIVFYENNNTIAKAYNVKELNPLKIGFDSEMVDFDKDHNYGKVFIVDIVIDDPDIGRVVTKLVYVVVENSKFAIDYLLKWRIKIKWIIRSCYGHLFGYGRSNGGFLFQIYKELDVKFAVSDLNGDCAFDIADKYLNESQRSTIPVLKKIANLTNCRCWAGYDDDVLYLVIGYEIEESAKEKGLRCIYEE